MSRLADIGKAVASFFLPRGYLAELAEPPTLTDVINPPEPIPAELTWGPLHYPEGTTIRCPDCSAVVARAERNIYRHEKMAAAPWGLAPGSVQRHCQTDYVRTFDTRSAVHTSAGWYLGRDASGEDHYVEAK